MEKFDVGGFCKYLIEINFGVKQESLEKQRKTTESSGQEEC